MERAGGEDESGDRQNRCEERRQLERHGADQHDGADQPDDGARQRDGVGDAVEAGNGEGVGVVAPDGNGQPRIEAQGGDEVLSDPIELHGVPAGGGGAAPDHARRPPFGACLAPGVKGRARLGQRAPLAKPHPMPLYAPHGRAFWPGRRRALEA